AEAAEQRSVELTAEQEEVLMREQAALIAQRTAEGRAAGILPPTPEPVAGPSGVNAPEQVAAETVKLTAAAKGSDYKGGSSGNSNKDKDKDEKEIPQTLKRSKTIGSSSLLPAVEKMATKLVTPSKRHADKIIPSYALPAKTTFSNMQLRNLLALYCDNVMLDTDQGVGESVRRIKGKKTASAEARRQFKLRKGACNKCWADNNPEACWFPTAALPCYRCNALKRACTYSSVKSRKCGKVNPIVQRTFESQEPITPPPSPSQQRPSVPPIASLPLPSDQDEEEAEDPFNSFSVALKGCCAASLVMYPNWTPLPIPQVTGQEFLWLGRELHYPVSVLQPCPDLEAYRKQVAGMAVVISRDMRTANAEMAGLRMRRRVMFRSLDILERYQNDCMEALQWQDDNQVKHTPPATFFLLLPGASLDMSTDSD
ncbi:hypothetical protein C0992_008564, partial [Termitomyces sp. T32_za158]